MTDLRNEIVEVFFLLIVRIMQNLVEVLCICKELPQFKTF